MSLVENLLETAPTPHALYALRQLDANHRLDPYLYLHILGYQAYDSSIHTSEKALCENNVLLVQFLIENGLWTLKTNQALKMSFVKGSYNVCEYLLYIFNIPLSQLEGVFSGYPDTWWRNDEIDDDGDDLSKYYKPFTREFILYLIQNYTPLSSTVTTIGYWLIDYTRDKKLLKMVFEKGWITWRMLFFYEIRREPTIESVDELLTYEGANIDYGMQTACSNKDIDIDIIRYLVECGASASRNSLSWAVYHSNIPLIKFLIEQGLSVPTAIKFSKWYDTPTVIQFLNENYKVV
jgi:hypothetical protein